MQHQFGIIYNLIFQAQQQRAMTPTKSHRHHFQVSNSLLSSQSISARVPPTRPQGHLRFQDGGWTTGPPEAVYMEVGSS